MIGRSIYTMTKAVNASADPFNLSVDMPAWYAEALCPQVDLEGFFPEMGGSTKNAKKTCAQCPVQKKCLEYALDKEIRYGVWGGASEVDRKKIRRQRRIDRNGEAA